MDVHEEGLAQYKNGTDIASLSEEQLQEIKNEAYGRLVNLLYSNPKAKLEPADYFRGYVTQEKEVKVADGQDGKPIKELQKIKVKVYPAPFFEVEKEESPAA